MSPKKAPARRAGRSPRAELRPCCPQWQRFPETSKSWAWQTMHRLGHSRITFSEATVAALAQANTTERARELLASAVNFGWIEPLAQQTGIYVGRLPPFTRNED